MKHSHNEWIKGAIQALLAGWAVVLFVSTGFTWYAMACLAGLNVCLGIALAQRPGSVCDWETRASFLAWICSAGLMVGALDDWVYATLLLDVRGVLLAATPEVIAFTLWLATSGSNAPSSKPRWRGLSLCWLIFGEAVWLGVGYFQDREWIFFGAVLVIVLTLALSKRRFGYGWLATQSVNSVILLLIGLPIADVFARAYLPPPPGGEGHLAIPNSSEGPRELNAENAHYFYSYDEAHGDPAAFAAWNRYYVLGYTRAAQQGLYEPMPGHRPAHRLRPGGRATLLECPISINSRGFRGREIAVPKEDVYRIVCLGESTTFGITIKKTDRPWPELLEEMINERLKPSRRVEVVNAGMPGWDLSGNLERLRPEILPLDPDMIISYHGYNGFGMIDSSFPPVSAPPLPPYHNRPLRLIGDFEYELEVRAFMRKFQPDGLREATGRMPPLETRYASCYRQLIAFAQTNHIRLALANFCMAIDEKSGRNLINFYSGFGAGTLCVRTGVNAVHSEIVQQLAEQNPGVCFIDTHPGLEGEHNKFIDIVHFTQEGRRRLAENIFAGIRQRLKEDLAQTNK
jgi:lysophospholipase L1-like esterase